MGSYVEINDTLQLTKEQGFPAELDIEQHLKTPFKVEDLRDKIFEFKNKPGIRLFHVPPIRTFFVENRQDKWIYWGHILVLEVTHNYELQTTSGKYKIVTLFSTNEMRRAFGMIDLRPDKNYLAN